MAADDPNLVRFEAALGYTFKDRALLVEALTHSSYRNENTDVDYDNERLEFLGDAVLGCVVSHMLWESYPDRAEGDMTRFRALLVSEDGLARAARHLSLGEYLYLGRGEELTGGRDKPSVLADGYESLVCAIYLDGGYARAEAFIRSQFEEQVEHIPGLHRRSDFKTKAQEIIQERLRTVPRYRVTAEVGPDHDKRFEVVLVVRGHVLGTGTGRSKKEAEEEAARQFHTQHEAGEVPFDSLSAELP
jgi:ribonuclease-3